MVSPTASKMFIGLDNFKENILKTQNLQIHMVRFNEGDKPSDKQYACMLDCRETFVSTDSLDTSKTYDFYSTSSFCEYLYKSARYELIKYHISDSKRKENNKVEVTFTSFKYDNYPSFPLTYTA